MDAPTPDGRAYKTNQVWLEFGDGLYLFRLKLKQIAELQEKSNAGIGAIYARVELGDYWVEDLNESIRLGLIGGAQGIVEEEEVQVTASSALKLCHRYLEDMTLSERWILAQAILRACVVGYTPPKDEKSDSGKADASTTTTPEQTG